MAHANDGRFIWYDLLTSNPEGAVAFYSHVLGWKPQTWQNGYTLLVGAQGPLCGAARLPESAMEMGAPPHWTSNVQVADIDAAVALVRALEGRVYAEPTDFPKVGRVAVIADPQGAAINLFEPAEPPALHDSGRAGEFTWSELATSDPEAALRFYGALFGWRRVRDVDMGPAGKYLVFGGNGEDLGGVFAKPKELPICAWLYYVRVENVADTLGRARAKGARVLVAPTDVPGGRMAQFLDPQGAAFALHQAGNAAGS
jgi:predicted enzyme related to lactoylglutathione lyase